MFDFVLKSLSFIVCEIQEKCNEIQGCGFVGSSFIFDSSGSTYSALKRLISCALFSLSKEVNDMYCESLEAIIRSVENILVALAKLFATISNCTCTNFSGSVTQGFPVSLSFHDCSPGERTVQIVDMDLDADDGSKDADSLVASGSHNSVTSLAPLQWKLKLVSVISLFFSVAPVVTWQTLLDMVIVEKDDKVSDTILHNLCKHFRGSAGLFSDLVRLIINKMEKSASMKIFSVNILSAIHVLLSTLLSMSSGGKHVEDALQTKEKMVSEEIAGTSLSK